MLLTYSKEQKVLNIIEGIPMTLSCQLFTQFKRTYWVRIVI